MAGWRISEGPLVPTTRTTLPLPQGRIRPLSVFGAHPSPRPYFVQWMRGLITSDFDLTLPWMAGKCAGPCFFTTCENDARTGTSRKYSILFQAFSASSTVVPWQCIGELRVGKRRVRGESRQNEIEARETLHAAYASDSVRVTLSRSGCAACVCVRVSYSF
jgi:hypothetical protein